MQLCKVRRKSGETHAAILDNEAVRLLSVSLTDVLHADNPAERARQALTSTTLPLAEVSLLPPVDQQEIWAAGVTYKRSQEARERESQGAARFYDLVYSAARPELFFKAPPYRVVGPGGKVRIRRDSKWNVPEPEVALVLAPSLRIVGFTIGNDMSSRDIEGENPLYLPQAKMYDGSCAVGPVITMTESMPPLDTVQIRLSIVRAGTQVFEGTTSTAMMARKFEDLAAWLGRETTFPMGAILLTGTGIVPPDHFTLECGDVVTIEVSGIGKLTNTVEMNE